MAKRRRRKLKIKLKKETIYTLFALGFIVAGLLQLLSFSNQGDVFISVNAMLTDYLGSMRFLFPFVFIFFGFFFLQFKKFFLSRPHVAIGYLITFVSLTGLIKAGSVGMHLFQILSDILGTAGTSIVYIAGFFVGLVVFFDTSLDELMHGLVVALNVLPKLLPGAATSFFKTTKNPKDKEMTIKQLGLKDDEGKGKNKLPLFADNSGKEPVVNKKEQSSLISDKLVTNMLSTTGGIWENPPLSLLSDGPGAKAERGDIKKIASIIEKTLQSFGIAARVAEVNLGPAVTQYALELALGTKVSKITSLANDLALATEAPSGQIRIEAPIPGRNLVGIEIPNRSLEVVPLRTMLASGTMQKNKSKLTVALGLDVSGNPVVTDISKMPHVLIAGTTGSGKSLRANLVCYGHHVHAFSDGQSVQ